MSAAAAVLVFMVCHAADPPGAWCPDGEVRARTCAQAEDWIRGWLRPGDRLTVLSCEEGRAP